MTTLNTAAESGLAYHRTLAIEATRAAIERYEAACRRVEEMHSSGITTEDEADSRDDIRFADSWRSAAYDERADSEDALIGIIKRWDTREIRWGDRLYIANPVPVGEQDPDNSERERISAVDLERVVRVN